MKHLYKKKKINSFKEKTEPLFKGMQSKKIETINITKNNSKNKNNKECLENNKENKEIKDYLFDEKISEIKKYYYSIDIENIRNDNNNNHRNHSNITNNNKANYNSHNNYNKNIFSKEIHSDIKNITKIKKLLNCQNNEQCIDKIKNFTKQKEFIDKIFTIYHKNKNNNEKINSNNYESIILWINYLLNNKQKNENDKYEKFCLELMKENKINDFPNFQKFTKNLINEKKSTSLFIEDIKKILSVDSNK